jgi:hypothetical protein
MRYVDRIILINVLFLRMSETLSTSVNTTQEDVSISTRTNKNGRAQTISSMEPKTAPPKSSTIRKTRGKSSRSERRSIR